jgi:transcriptional regulator with XRE-family HTH domain
MQPVVFQKLQAWQDSEDGKTDAELADAIDVNPSTIWRAKRGLRVLGMEHQLALQKITGIPPSEWADFYAQTVALRRKPSGPTLKKSPVAEEAA